MNETDKQELRTMLPEGQEVLDALLEWLKGVNHVHTSRGIVYAFAVEAALRTTRQELINTQTMESAQKQLSNELVDRLSKANGRIAELEQQLGIVIQNFTKQAQRDRERIEKLERLLGAALDGVMWKHGPSHQLALDISDALAKKEEKDA